MERHPDRNMLDPMMNVDPPQHSRQSMNLFDDDRRSHNRSDDDQVEISNDLDLQNTSKLDPLQMSFRENLDTQKYEDMPTNL